MMNLTFNTRYKSITSLTTPGRLPNFVVLSGINGSGKTQLLEAINNEMVRVIDGKGNELKPIFFADHNALTPRENSRISADSLNNRGMRDLYPTLDSIKQKRAELAHFDVNHFCRTNPAAATLMRIARSLNKEIYDLSKEEASRHYVLHDEEPAIFRTDVSKIFKWYANEQFNNAVNRTLSQDGASYEYLKTEEFLKQYGPPPWETLNQIIAEAKFDYEVNVPKTSTPNAEFEAKLIHRHKQTEILFTDLSSGEKVIISLILALYQAKGTIEFPKVLLLDEPDAHLHPSMAKQFLDVVQNVLVRDKGVRVIMTTHSPSTVALTSEESIFLMTNQTEPEITKVSKDKALQLLTTGVPTLSVLYENRRQVFVESDNDVRFYEGLYERVKSHLDVAISLTFISSGIGNSGNCDQVRDIVQLLSKGGNKWIYGIIDWDLKNVAVGQLRVLGQGKRYSIESYLFDPILIAILLLRDKIIKNADIGLQDSETYMKFSEFSNEKLQDIADCIITSIAQKNTESMSADSIDVEYLCGRRISLPTWYIQTNGHKLESLLKNTYPQLNRHKNEGALKNEIIAKIIDDFPGFVSVDIVTLFREIQEGRHQ